MHLPSPSSRRWFLKGGAAVLTAACTGTVDGTDATDDTDVQPACPDPFEGGTLLGTLPFVGEDDQAVGREEGAELNGRLAIDHSTLDADSLQTSNEAFFIRTLPPASLPAATGWTIEVTGLASSTSIAVEDLLDEVQDQGMVLLECSGNQDNRHFGLISAAQWSGVPVSEVFDRLTIDDAASHVQIGGYDAHTQPSSSTPGCSWIYTFEQLEQAGAFFATHMNGQPLPVKHGAPIRLIVPGWYGCCSAKWVNFLHFVGEDAASTSHMREFAGRTHQVGVPGLARDFAPARMQVSAMAVRVERWMVDDVVKYKIVGIVWGGDGPAERLQIRAGEAEPWRDVSLCPEQTTSRTWTLWEVEWQPDRAGVHLLELHAPDDASQRLDMGWYTRAVDVPG